MQRGTGPDMKYRTTIGSARYILSAEGARAFYKGFGSGSLIFVSCLGLFSAVAAFTLPAHGLYFAGYEYAKRRFRLVGEETALGHFAAGIVADLAGALLWCPQVHLMQCLLLMTAQDVIK